MAHRREIGAKAPQEVVQRGDNIVRTLLRLEHGDLALRHEHVGRVLLEHFGVQRFRLGVLATLLLQNGAQALDSVSM